MEMFEAEQKKEKMIVLNYSKNGSSNTSTRIWVRSILAPKEEPRYYFVSAFELDDIDPIEEVIIQIKKEIYDKQKK